MNTAYCVDKFTKELNITALLLTSSVYLPLLYMFLFRFRNECPDGKLTKQHLKTLFEKVFPDGEKTYDSKSIFEKLNHAKWSPLTFSHQEMPQRSRLRFSASLIPMGMTSSILKSSLWQLMWPIEQQVDSATSLLKNLQSELQNVN